MCKHPSVSFPGHKSNDGAGACRKVRRIIMGKYITNLAEGFIGQLKAKVEAEDFDEKWKWNPLVFNLYARHNEAIRAQLRRMRPETLGKIAACGVGNPDEVSEDESLRDYAAYSLYQVHCGTYLDKYASGIALLREIACTAIIAEMTNILKRRAATP